MWKRILLALVIYLVVEDLVEMAIDTPYLNVIVGAALAGLYYSRSTAKAREAFQSVGVTNAATSVTNEAPVLAALASSGATEATGGGGGVWEETLDEDTPDIAEPQAPKIVEHVEDWKQTGGDAAFEELQAMLLQDGHSPSPTGAMWKADTPTVYCTRCGERWWTYKQRACDGSPEGKRRRQRREDLLALAVFVATGALLASAVINYGLGETRLYIPATLIVVAAGDYLRLRRKRRLQRVGVATTGAVEATGPDSMIRFTDWDGGQHTFKAPGGLSGTVEVVFDQGKPERAKTVRDLEVTRTEWGRVWVVGLAIPALVIGALNQQATDPGFASDPLPGVEVYEDYGIRFEYPNHLEVVEVTGGDRPNADEYAGVVGIADPYGVHHEVLVVQWLPSPFPDDVTRETVDGFMVGLHELTLAGVAAKPGDWLARKDFKGWPVRARSLETETDDGTDLKGVLAVAHDGEHVLLFMSMRPIEAAIELLEADVDSLMASFEG